MRILNVGDLREAARRRLPRVVFDYVDGGADDEVTLRENCRVFDEVVLRPRQAVAFSECNLKVRVLGRELAFPGILAPIGYSRLLHPRGELAAAAAAGKAGTVFILSTISGHRMELAKAETSEDAWYQLYLVGGRAAAEPALERAAKAGFKVLVVTVDTAVAGMRERDPRNGMREMMGESLVAKLPYVGELLAHPGWLYGFLRDGGVPRLENVVLPGAGPMEMKDVAAALADAVVTWADFAWIREAWKGPIVVKGILTAADAQRAVNEGAAGVVVSNHGGRQLDGASATLRALPEVVAAVGTRTEVLMDGGIRRGSDIVKALCLGAKAVLLGRAYAYGLAAAGDAGVARALAILRSGVERTMRLLGCADVKDLGPEFIEVRFGEMRR